MTTLERQTVRAGTPLRCGNCTSVVGQAGVDLRYEGHYENPRDRPGDRELFFWRCGKCGTGTCFRIARMSLWRYVELKVGA